VYNGVKSTPLSDFFDPTKSPKLIICKFCLFNNLFGRFCCQLGIRVVTCMGKKLKIAKKNRFISLSSDILATSKIFCHR
jgi:hypothetical protein